VIVIVPHTYSEWEGAVKDGDLLNSIHMNSHAIYDPHATLTSKCNLGREELEHEVVGQKKETNVLSIGPVTMNKNLQNAAPPVFVVDEHTQGMAQNSMLEATHSASPLGMDEAI
jgi:hypothetical protein